MLQAGRLHHRVSIEVPTQVSDGHDGYAKDTWAPARRRIAGRVDPLVGKALDRARQVDPRAGHDVTVRYWTGWRAVFSQRARIVWHDEPNGTRVLEPIEPPRETEARVTLTVACREAA